MSSVSHVVAEASSIDWNVVASATATFVVTAVVSWFGLRRGRKAVEEKTHIDNKAETVAIRGGVLMDNMSMHRLTEAIDDNTRATDTQTASNLRLWEQLVEVRMELREVKNKL